MIFFEHLSPEKRPPLSLLLAGYTTDGKSEIYTLKSQDNFVPRKSVTGFNCIGVPYIADYLLNRFYSSEIKVDASAEMCVLCIQETGNQDLSVGGPTRIYMFSTTKDFVEFPSSDVEKLKEKTQLFQVNQKNRFYPEDPNSGILAPTSF